MGRFDYPEQWAVRQARQSVLDSLMSHGEMCIVFQSFHSSTDPGAERCICYDDVYKSQERQYCTICYGTSFKGFKEVARVWGIFEDAPRQERQEKRGSWTPDTRRFQTEGLVSLNSGDFVARVSYWDGERPLTIEGVYVLGEVRQESLRTGARYGQSYFDVVGQNSTLNRLTDEHPIYKFNFDQTFSRPKEALYGNTY